MSLSLEERGSGQNRFRSRHQLDNECVLPHHRHSSPQPLPDALDDADGTDDADGGEPTRAGADGEGGAALRCGAAGVTVLSRSITVCSWPLESMATSAKKPRTEAAISCAGVHRLSAGGQIVPPEITTTEAEILALNRCGELTR